MEKMETVVKGKPEALCATFDRKEGSDKQTTHYCPGCGHGRVHKLIAEALSDMGLGDKTVFISPVGCSVFAYYYMNTGNVQAPHGRAPAVATGVSRANPNSIVISYQGDGDLAAIGTAEILHAANRGEHLSVFFINNAIYGMTGGQMAPTTLLGQKTQTTPRGRSAMNEGHPIRMAEIIATLEAPIYVERTSCTDTKGIMKTRKAIRKAIKLQSEKKGFTFVEILTACPTGWKKTPSDSIKWIQNELEPYFKPGVYKDVSDKAEPLHRPEMIMDSEEIFKSLGLKKGKTPSSSAAAVEEKRIKIAGFGGQGALTAGVMMATAGMNEGLNVSWIPSYGPEMRGGTANCSVIVSSKRIGNPLVRNPNILIAMNGPSLDAFENDVVQGGTIVVNSSLIERKLSRSDVKAVYVPLTDIAAKVGLKAAANSVALGVFLGLENIFSREGIYEVLKTSLKKKDALEINIKAVNAGFEFAKTL
ncbi:MAG TPA: 2-ketoisovalerate ferredoxin oxidoreductase [Bdellovibrionales bacterium]|nr:2-ketoisovalerate ferredoxin oxidoreductase [Bdellovibrionales bacterium]HCM40870.1 2-ketoisovalerate ferredoxin oxidoreductase [Bdellovibrionales bacterium]